MKITILREHDKFQLETDPIIFDNVTDVILKMSENSLDIRRISQGQPIRQTLELRNERADILISE
jgi:hypothetical protein